MHVILLFCREKGAFKFHIFVYAFNVHFLYSLQVNFSDVLHAGQNIWFGHPYTKKAIPSKTDL